MIKVRPGWVSLWAMGLVLLGGGCESRSFDEMDLDGRLLKMAKAAGEGFLPTVGAEYALADRLLDKMVERQQPLFGQPADAYRKQFNAAVAGMLKKNWGRIHTREMKAARVPGNRADTDWNRRNRARLEALFSALGDEDVVRSWVLLKEERGRVEAAAAAGEQVAAVDSASGKVLVWSEGFADKDLTDCVLAAVKPQIPDREWLQLPKPPGEEARAAAWGTLAIAAEVDFAEYRAGDQGIGGQIQSRVPLRLSLTVTPRWPGVPGLPARWQVQVARQSPEQIVGTNRDPAKLKASQLALDAFRDLWSRGCSGFRDQVAKRPSAHPPGP